MGKRRANSGIHFEFHLAHVAQLVEHVLGKDEVTGSNPVMGSVAVKPRVGTLTAEFRSGEQKDLKPQGKEIRISGERGIQPFETPRQHRNHWAR